MTARPVPTQKTSALSAPSAVNKNPAIRKQAPGVAQGFVIVINPSPVILTAVGIQSPFSHPT